MRSLPPAHHAALRQALESRCGFHITNVRDCQELLNAIVASSPNHRLGLSTLRRFFGLVDYAGGFSSTSLNILARHCGYSSYASFVAALSPEDPEPESHSPVQAAGNRLKALLDHLKSHGQGDVHIMRDLVRSTIQIQSHPDLADAMWKTAHAHEATRRPFTDLAPPLDWMSSFGHVQMEDYLLRSKTDEERCFAHSLLAFGRIMRGDWEGGSAQLAHTPDVYREDLHPLPQGRALSLHMLVAGWRQDWSAAHRFLDVLTEALNHQEVHSEVPFLQRVLTPFLCLALGQRWPEDLDSRLLRLTQRCVTRLEVWLDQRDPFIDSPEGIGWYKQSSWMGAALTLPLERVRMEISRTGFQASFASDKTIQAIQFHTISAALNPPGSPARMRSEEVVRWGVQKMNYPELGEMLALYGQRISDRT